MEGRGGVKAPLTRGETLPKLGVDAGPEKAWRLADEETDGPLASRGWRGEVGLWPVGEERRMTLGWRGSGLWRRHHNLPKRSRYPRVGAQDWCPALVGGFVLGWRRGMLPHQVKGGGGEHDQEGLVPWARGLRG